MRRLCAVVAVTMAMSLLGAATSVTGLAAPTRAPVPVPVTPIQTRALPPTLSPPLRDMKLKSPLVRRSHAPLRGTRVSAPIDLPDTGFTDPVLQTTTATPRAPRPLQSFDGIDATRMLPPDPVGDVGPNHYVQAVNRAFAIWDKSGRVQSQPASIETLWQSVGGPCATQGKGDPIVQHDLLADRWLISEFAFSQTGGSRLPPFYQCIAISATSDPLGRWYLYPFIVSSTSFPDYPKFGVWPDGYYLTVHLYDTSGSEYIGQGIYAFDRRTMLNGGETDAPIAYQTGPEYTGLLPADLDGSTRPPDGSPNYLFTAQDDGRTFPNDRLEILEFDVNFADPAASTVTSSAFLPTAAFDTNMCNDSFECLPQRGTNRRLDAIGESILMYRLAYRNFGSHESVVLNHVVDVDGSDHAGIRWYEVRNPSTSPRIHQQGTYAPDGDHRWVGSIAMDSASGIALGYSVTGPSLYPSVRYAGRAAGDPLGLMSQGEATLIAGGGSQLGENRWGDYSALTVDPKDDCTFWYTQEYYRTSSDSAWSTRIGSFRLPECGGTSPDPSTSPDPEPTPSQSPSPNRDGHITDVSDKPDPFSPDGDGRRERSKIFFTLTERGFVTVAIKRSARDVVKRLTATDLEAGRWVVRWNGRTSARTRAPSGTYIYVIKARHDDGSTSRTKGTVTLRR